MEVPKSQEKLNIKRFSNKRRTMGQNPYFYEVRNYENRYIGDICFLEMNNQWYLSCTYLSATQLEELSTFINNLPKNKSRYEKDDK